MGRELLDGEREIVGKRERERPGYSLFSDSATSGSLVEWSLGISESTGGLGITFL